MTTATKEPIEAEVIGGEKVNTQTGEVIEDKTSALAVVDAPQLPAPADSFRGYMGAAMLQITPDEATALQETLPEDIHDILPTGEVYVSQVQYRRLLNKTFGPGQWALVPRGEFIKQGNTICREYALVVRGHFVAEAVGEQDYHESNDRMSWATAAEACKSNALTRCCKDLGIASECWDKRWAEVWKAKFALQVWCKVKERGEEKTKPQWRRKDAQPFWNESGPVQQKGSQKPPPEKPPQEKTEPPKPDVPPVQDLPGPYLTTGEISLLFGTAKSYGIKKKDDIYPIASKALGVQITSIKQIPSARLDDVIRAISGGPR